MINQLTKEDIKKRFDDAYDKPVDFSLVGFLIGNSSEMVNFEMDILTVYYNIGIIGVIMLCIPFLWCVVPRIRSRISLAYTTSFLVTIFFTGHIIEK